MRRFALITALIAACNGSSDKQPAASASAAPSGSAPSAASTTTSTSASTSTSTSMSGGEAPPPAELFAWEKRAKAGPPPEDAWGDEKQWKGTLAEENELMLAQMAYFHGYDEAEMAAVKAIFAGSDVMGQGAPSSAKHAASPAECKKKLADAKVDYDRRDFAKKCGARWMAPLFDPAKGETIADAKTCIDDFEFPDVPCVYPATWARANEAAQICDALGKRLCDAHEWEGACYGALGPPDYDFDLYKRASQEDAHRAMQGRHNIEANKTKRWAYGPKYQSGICATASHKSKDCGMGWRKCGTNTFPAGMFPGCVSSFGVYDLHGNAAEHMNLPFAPEEMSSVPKEKRIYGHTEMKGSWFVFDEIHAHEDHCRWRAPYWHGSKIMNPSSHRNYHLGFRCCKSIE